MTSEKTTNSWQPKIKLKLKTTITLEKQEKPLAQGVRALFFEFLSRKTGKTIRLKKNWWPEQKLYKQLIDKQDYGFVHQHKKPLGQR